MNQQNGNEKLNESREVINDKITRYTLLGKAKRKYWNSKRRFRTI